MKKILLFLIIILGLSFSVSAKETPINVIYIHGSNQLNIGGLDGFTKWMNRMHSSLKKNFEKSAFIQLHLLSNSYIKDQPDMLYWADKLRDNKSLIDYGLKKSGEKSNKIDQMIRGLIAQTVHDAVWLQKKQNMAYILDELNSKVNKNYKNGEKTMFVGYSAGTFITMKYLLLRTPIINLSNLFETFKGQNNITDRDISLATEYAKQNTCVYAAIKSNLFYVDSERKLLLNPDPIQRERAMQQIEEQTQLSCAPEGAIVGVLNFGSPIVVFYSELSDADALNKYILEKTMQNVIETNKFYLTVNYSKDPIAMPIPDFTFEKMTKYTNCKGIKKGNGFIYDTMVKGGNVAVEGHRHYWYSTNKYTKAVAKAYENGYKYFYNKQ